MSAQRAVKIERFALERGVEADSQLQLVDVALEDRALHLGDELEVTSAVERLRRRAARMQRLRKERARGQETIDVAVDAALERLRIAAARPDRKRVGKVIEDQPRRGDRDERARHHRIGGRSRR